jgi:hypothetical protein
VNLPARAVPCCGSVVFPRRVFHTALPVASPPSRQLGPPGCPFPLLSSRFSPVLSGGLGCGPSGARAGQASRPALAPARGPTTYPHADTLGSRPSHAASRQPLRGKRFAPSKFPPIFGSCLHVNPPLSASDSALCSSARCRFVCPALRPRARPPRAGGYLRNAEGRIFGTYERRDATPIWNLGTL